MGWGESGVSGVGWSESGVRVGWGGVRVGEVVSIDGLREQFMLAQCVAHCITPRMVTHCHVH